MIHEYKVQSINLNNELVESKNDDVGTVILLDDNNNELDHAIWFDMDGEHYICIQSPYDEDEYEMVLVSDIEQGEILSIYF